MRGAWLLLASLATISLPAQAEEVRFCEAKSASLMNAGTTADLFKEDACDPYSLAVQAYVWGKPIVDAAKIRVFFTQPDDPLAARHPSVAGAALNRFGHGRILADPANKSGVGPNNDTLYSNATFDLLSGPFIVTLPDFGDRYYTFSVAHPDSSTSLSLGSRTHGGQLPPLFLHHKDYDGEIPAGMYAIESGDRYLHLWGRTLVRPDEDLGIVHALQDKMEVRRLAGGKLIATGVPPVQRPFPQGDDAVTFLRQLSASVADMELSPQDARVFDRLRPVLDWAAAPSSATATERTEILKGMADGATIVARAASDFGTRSGGWSVNTAGARFGSDWLLRAAIAKDQIFVTVPEEAIYPIARTDARGRPLDGSRTYRVRFDQPPPVDGFWSITLYNDAGFMVENPISRYSVGNRTDGVDFTDGHPVEIVIAPNQPTSRGAIWLPSPSEGFFYLMMRLYRPGSAIQKGEWLPPAVVPD